METTIAAIIRTKRNLCASIQPVCALKNSSDATTESAFRKPGSAITTTTAEITRTSRKNARIQIVSVPRDGRDAPRVTDASLDGPSATDTTTAGTIPMNNWTGVPPAILLEISDAQQRTSAYRDDGCATTRMTAVTIRTRLMPLAEELLDLAQSQSSVVETESVSGKIRCATEKLNVATTPTRPTVNKGTALSESANALTELASTRNCGAIGGKTVPTPPTKPYAIIRSEERAVLTNSVARIACAFPKSLCATETTTAETIRMRPTLCVRKPSASHR